MVAEDDSSVVGEEATGGEAVGSKVVDLAAPVGSEVEL